MSAAEWWGGICSSADSLPLTASQINYQRYPVWGSLAWDYLAIMASSVSSERVFSSAGSTVSKRRNRLRGDIVEALQCLKCLICRELLFRQSEIVDLEADDWEVAEEDDAEGWDCFLDDDEGNYDADIVVDDEL
jgi:hypothetical protein